MPSQGSSSSSTSGFEASARANASCCCPLVEQSLEFVKSVGDYFYVLDKGAIAWEGELEALDEEVVRKYLTV